MDMFYDGMFTFHHIKIYEFTILLKQYKTRTERIIKFGAFSLDMTKSPIKPTDVIIKIKAKSK